MTYRISFTNCPECGVAIGNQGLARHRKAQHGVAPASKGKKVKKPQLTAEERIAKLKAQGIL